MNPIVITGGAGFIGSGLVRRLLAHGAERVTVFDNLYSGKEANLAEVRERWISSAAISASTLLWLRP